LPRHHFLLAYELVLNANHLKFAGQDRASLTSPSNGGSPNPLPANQQQSVPNAHAVPPAIAAGHASPKPSAATAGLTCRHSLVSLLLIYVTFAFGYVVKSI